MEILIIGGTRNIGHLLALELLRQGHQVTVFNRGKTPDELPAAVRRLHGDRSDPTSTAEELAGKSFDAVVDMALYNAADAKMISKLLDGRIGQYLFISTGQVYLVRKDSPRPFRENAYENPILEAPRGTRDYEEWLYGVGKSQAEDMLMEAYQRRGFPLTTLRLPMVNSERDHFHRVHNYLLRLQDGGTILLPKGDHLRSRHVYGEDVVQATKKVIEGGLGKGRVYNISQEETLPIEEFLGLLANIAGCELKLAYLPRNVLEEHSLFPDCSPFSDPWMSELDNERSKMELGMQYTSVPVYLQKMVSYYQRHRLPLPAGYQRRMDEIRLANQS
jgi:nucleoside-diphosphate-sugar epimerase